MGVANHLIYKISGDQAQTKDIIASTPNHISPNAIFVETGVDASTRVTDSSTAASRLAHFCLSSFVPRQLGGASDDLLGQAQAQALQVEREEKAATRLRSCVSYLLWHVTPPRLPAGLVGGRRSRSW